MIGRRHVPLVKFSDCISYTRGKGATLNEGWKVMLCPGVLTRSHKVEVAGNQSIHASRISTSANCDLVGTSVDVSRGSRWANCQRSRSFPLNLPHKMFPAPGGVGPPHSALIKDKLSRSGNRFITEMIFAARTLEKMISTGWVDGGN